MIGTVLDTVSDKLINYYNEIPKDSLNTISKSAIFSFAYEVHNQLPTSSVNIGSALLNGAMGALVSAIYSLITPLFNKIFNTTKPNIFQEVSKDLVCHFITSALVVYGTASNINIFAIPFLKFLSANTFKVIINTFVDFSKLNPQLYQFLQSGLVYFGIDHKDNAPSICLVSGWIK